MIFEKFLSRDGSWRVFWRWEEKINSRIIKNFHYSIASVHNNVLIIIIYSKGFSRIGLGGFAL